MQDLTRMEHAEIQRFINYLIYHCEGDEISEECLQLQLSKFIKKHAKACERTKKSQKYLVDNFTTL